MPEIDRFSEEEAAERIVGKGWKVKYDEVIEIWTAEFPDEGADLDSCFRVLDMLEEEFPRKRIWESYRPFSEVIWGRLLGTLYPDAVEFLNKWGIEATLEGFSGYGGESSQKPPTRLKN